MFGMRARGRRLDAIERELGVIGRTINSLIKHLTDQGLPRGLDRIERAISALERKTMATLDDLRAAVARDTEVTTSAVTLLRGIKAKLDEAIASGDPAALQQLADDIEANTNTMADAVAENTPAEDPPVE